MRVAFGARLQSTYATYATLAGYPEWRFWLKTAFLRLRP